MVSLLISVSFLPTEATPRETHFSLVMFIKENFFSKNVFLHVTNCRRSDHGSFIFNFIAPDSNLEHPILSAEFILFLTFSVPES